MVCLFSMSHTLDACFLRKSYHIIHTGLERVDPDGSSITYSVDLIRSKVVDKAKVSSIPMLDPIAAIALSLRCVFRSSSRPTCCILSCRHLSVWWLLIKEACECLLACCTLLFVSKSIICVSHSGHPSCRDTTKSPHHWRYKSAWHMSPRNQAIPHLGATRPVCVHHSSFLYLV